MCVCVSAAAELGIGGAGGGAGGAGDGHKQSKFLLTVCMALKLCSVWLPYVLVDFSATL